MTIRRLYRYSFRTFKTGYPLMKKIHKPLPKKVLIPLEITAAAATDVAIHKKCSDLVLQH